MTFKKVRWALRFPLSPLSKDPAARRFSSTPVFRQGPSSGEALEGAIRVAAPLTYAQEDSVFLPDSHFLKLPSFERIYGKITRNVNPSPPDEHIVHWLRAQAPRLAQRDEGDKSAILPASLPFSAALSLYLRLLNLSRLDTAMTKRQSNSCAPSFATTK